MSVELLNKRRWFGSRSTEGEWYLDGRFECYGLEDFSPWDQPGALEDPAAFKVAQQTCIPPRRYRLVLEYSPKFGPDTLTITDVPAFDFIRIHAGNKDTDTDGCPIVGQDRTDPYDNWIGHSGAALKALKAKVVPRMKAGEDAYITITEER